MKRKRILGESLQLAKRRKQKIQEYYVFLRVFTSQKTSTPTVLLYDIQTNKLFFKNVIFFNWFYSTKIIPSKYVIKTELVKNVLLSSGKKLTNDIYKIYYSSTKIFQDYKVHKPSKLYTKNENYENYEVYESNIPRHVRLITFYNLKFLDVVDGLLCHKNMEFQIPIVLEHYNNRKFYYLNESRELIPCHQIPTQPVIIVNWCAHKKRPYPVMFLCLKDMYFGFLRAHKDSHESKQKLPLHESFILLKKAFDQNCREYFPILVKLFESYFCQVLYMSSIIPMSILELMGLKNRKFISDYVYLTNKGNIVAVPPENQPDYSSHAIIKLEMAKEIFKGDFTSLDFDSMYPSIMLKLFKNEKHLIPYYNTLKTLLLKKRNESNGHRKTSIKLIINSFYGNFGIKRAEFQCYIRSNTPLAEAIGKFGSELISNATRHFLMTNGNRIIHVHTDSLMGSIQKNDWRYKDPIGNNPIGNNHPFILREEWKTRKILFFNRTTYITDSKCVGWDFNSKYFPSIIRKYLKKFVIGLLNKVDTYEEFCKGINKSVIPPKLTEIITLKDLVFVQKKEEEEERKKREDEYMVQLISRLDNNLVNMTYQKALSLVIDVNQDIWGPIWKIYLKKLKKFLKC